MHWEKCFCERVARKKKDENQAQDVSYVDQGVSVFCYGEYGYCGCQGEAKRNPVPMPFISFEMHAELSSRGFWQLL